MRAAAAHRHLGEHRLPPNYEITPHERGPRRNLVLEAIAFDPTGSVLTSALEGPLIQDGPLPTTERGALARVTAQTRTGEVLGQYAYPIEPVFTSPPPGGRRPDTGVPAILAHPDDPDRFLVLERTYVEGTGFKVRLFEATTTGATDVQRVDSLADRPVQPMRKRLIVDFHDLELSTVDNIEGMTWGPQLTTQIIALALPGES
ncbi:esterase-like activity of phytase family protein [Saccharopolyspora indica]|uniref:esterase-like activity of phytase family protein n=1 Tax=Saccharopolyspora indica TaxID=1229659 RepID=UPI0022EB77CE|nr:esterase-like activity of phytase family protein [Saccharopolyspora indica]MDA3642806.1 esterase-like activity of phytase family protein [Saccharopolyspora indica]